MARVLVVEDDPDIRMLLTMQLAQQGHYVMAAPSAEKALKLVAAEGLPDVAVLDICLPRMNGLDLLARLKKQGPLLAVFLSSRVEPEVVAAGRALGAVYLTKPFGKAALLSAVDESQSLSPA